MLSLIEDFYTLDKKNYSLIYDTECNHFGVVLMVDSDDKPIVMYFDNRREALSFVTSLVRSLNEYIIEYLC